MQLHKKISIAIIGLLTLYFCLGAFSLVTDHLGVRIVLFIIIIGSTGSVGFLILKDLHHFQGSALDTDWAKTNYLKIMSVLQQESDIEPFASQLLKEICPLLSCGAGAVYIYDKEDKSLRATGFWGNEVPPNKRKQKPNTFIGGQALLDKKPITITPNNMGFELEGGLHQIPIKKAVYYPLIFQSEALGVLELYFVGVENQRNEQLLLTLTENLGAFIKNIQNNEKQKILLKAAQIQTESLKSHTNLLEKNNQTLKRQKGILDEKNAKLEELKQTLQKKSVELEKASTYKTQFLANMSHELRTPLNSIMVLSEVLSDDRDDSMPEEYRDYARSIHSAGKSLLDLISDILDLSKVEAGKLDIVKKDLDLKYFAKEINTLFFKQAEDKGLTFAVNIDDQVPLEIKMDPLRLNQILRNFLSNAFKFTKSGGITLDIIFIPGDKLPFDQPHLQGVDVIGFSVTDTGLGIPKEKQAKIFEEFTQADTDTAHNFGGTGLGLSICKKLTLLLDGHLAIESEEGKGSRFSVYFPAESATGAQAKPHSAKATAPLSAPTPKPDPAPPQAEDSTKNERESVSVVIIEDDPTFSNLLAAEIEAVGHSTKAFTFGEDARKWLEDNDTKGIILDLGLPDMDGRELLNELRKSEKLSHIPIHVVSGRDRSDANIGSEASFFEKPIGIKDIDDILKHIDNEEGIANKTLLVVEDDKMNQKAIAAALKEESIKIINAETVEEGLKAASDHQIDCVILDLTLPDADGKVFLEQIGQKTTKPPVIIYTGRDLSPEELSEYRRLSQSYVGKAEINSRKKLTTKVHKFLKNIGKPQKTKPPESKVKCYYDFKDKKILLVDDQPQNIFALASYLESLKLTVYKALSGEQALDLLQKHSPDIILTDIMMPEMDGFQLAAAIKELGTKYHKIPIIGSSANNVLLTSEQAKIFDETIPKPIETSKLGQTIDLILGEDPELKKVS